MEEQLRACVQQSLDDFMYSNAKFMAERLYAEFPTEANVLQLAKVYIIADQAYRAYHLLKGARWGSYRQMSLHARFLFAQSCFKLGKNDEAKAALKENEHGQMPGGAAGYYLLGQLHSLTDHPNLAMEAYQVALDLDPMMWAAYERLCQLGHNEDAEKALEQALRQESPQEAQQSWNSLNGTNGLSTFTPNLNFERMAASRLSFSSATPMTGLRQSQASSHTQNAFDNSESGASGNEFVTPSPGVMGPQVAEAPQRNPNFGMRVTPTPTPMQRGYGRAKPLLDENPYKFFDDGKLRKVSGKLFSEVAPAMRDSPNITTRRGSRLAASSNTPLIPAAPRQTHQAPHKTGIPRLNLAQVRETHEASAGAVLRGEGSAHGQHEVVSLLAAIGKPYGLLCMNKCQEAIAAFDELSAKQYKTAWVFCQIGRAYYEMVDFKAAAAVFQKAREFEPTRLEGMELFSTVLWHLKREVELSHLAQEAVMLDRLDPRSWCIMGNCFSLQKDQHAALKFFQRAVQLDPSFTYAYTLAGHENLALEQFDKSISCYRMAMRLDPRHYHAWYGCGQIFYRQEKYEVAAYHFEGSISINDRSSILLCYMGMALAKLNRHSEAKDMLRNAISLDAHNPLARFELANVLVEDQCFEQALNELKQLKDMAPKEASVYFHMGQIYRRLNRTDLALLQFSQALDLKPSSTDVNMIKSAIEKLRINDDFDDGV